MAMLPYGKPWDYQSSLASARQPGAIRSGCCEERGAPKLPQSCARVGFRGGNGFAAALPAPLEWLDETA